MNSTTTNPAIELPKQVAELILNSIDNAMKMYARILWSLLISFLKEHWILIMVVIFLVFIFATLKAMLGRWGTLGSVIYNSMYFGILFIVGLIWGPEIFINDFFNAACTIILYPVCYIVTGIILDKTGLKNTWR